MNRPPRLMICVAAIAGLLIAAASTASARPTKIAVTRIDGDTGNLRDTIADALDGSDRDIVSTGKLDRTIDKLGLADELSDRDLRKLAAALDADAVIQGAFDSRGHKLRLTIFANGKKGKPFNVQVSNASSDKFRKLVRTTMAPKLAAAVSAASKADADDDDARPSGKPSKPSMQDAKKRKADSAAEDADDDSPKRKARGNKASDEAVADADELPPKKAKGKKASDAAVAESDELPPKKAKGKKASDAAVAESDELPPKKSRSQKAKDAATDDSDELPPKKPRGKKASDAAAAESDELPPKTTRPRIAGDEAPAPADAAAPRAAGKQVAERDDDDAPQSTEARFEPGTRGGTRSANLDAARADLGTSMTARSLTFKTTALANAPTPYKNAPVPGARFEGELYPLALRDPGSVLSGIGVAGDFDQTVALTLRASAEMTVPLKATERHYSVGLRYRLAFGHTSTSPTLTFGAGYGARTFIVDRKALMSAASLDLPDVDYKLFDPGLAFRLPLGGMFAVTLGGRALLVTSAGAIQRADQYGPGTILGGSASAGLEIMLGNHVAVRLAGEATQLDFSFAGTGTLANSRDGNAQTIDVRGATDRYLGGAATLAVLY